MQSTRASTRLRIGLSLLLLLPLAACEPLPSGSAPTTVAGRDPADLSSDDPVADELGATVRLPANPPPATPTTVGNVPGITVPGAATTTPSTAPPAPTGGASGSVPPSSAAPTSPAPAPLPAGVQPWSSAATWGGAVPGAGADVVIPAGKTVLLDTNVTLGSLDIRGTLVCADRDLQVAARWIMVHGGKLSCGTAAAPFTKRLTITLTGAAGNEDVMGMGTKFLGLMGGAIELHGITKPLSWTSLAADTKVGATSIALTEAPSWNPGDRIVLATGSVDQNAVDVATVASVAGNTVTLAAPLQRKHLGKVVQVGSVSAPMRSSVGRLTRNIVITGDAGSAGAKFGAHLMFMAGGQTTVQMQGVEIAAAGQFDRLGRYPIHFHQMAEGCTSCYVRDSSIHDTIQRGIVLHDSNGIVVANNVVFNTIGHGVVVETAATTGNTIDRNLVLVNKPPRPAFKAAGLREQNDRLASSYWFKSARNTITNNVSAGSANAGFFYDHVADGPTDFRNNTAYGTTGIDDTEDFFPGSGLVALMCRTTMPAAPDFSGLLTFNNNTSGYWPEDCNLDGGGDNTRQWISGLTSLSQPFGVGVKDSGLVQVTDSTFILGERKGLGYANNAVHHQYAGHTIMRNITIVGSPNLLMSETDIAQPYQSRFTVSAVRIVDGGSEPVVPKAMVHYLDDSVVPRGFYLDAASPELATADCAPGSVQYDDDRYDFLRCPDAYVYGRVVLRAADTSGNEGGLTGPNLPDTMSLVRSDGRTTGQQTDWVSDFYVLLREGYSYSAPSIAASPFVIVRLEREFNPDGGISADTVLVSIPIGSAPAAVYRPAAGVDAEGARFIPDEPEAPNGAPALVAAASLADLAADPLGRYFYDAATGTITVTAGDEWVIVQR